MVARALPVTPPFDFKQSLSFLGEFFPAEGDQRLEQGTLTKAIRQNGQTVLFRVTARGSIDQPEVECSILHPANLSDETIEAVMGRASFFLSLEDDLMPLYELSEGDPPFNSIVQKLYGYHHVKFIAPFENFCWGILTMRTAMATARTFKGRIVAAYGDVVEWEGKRYPAFPEPSDMFGVDPNELTEKIGSERKAEYILGGAHALAEVDEDWLRHGDYEEVEKWLLNLKGIGPWIASFILVRSLGRMERLTNKEKRLQEAASRLYGRNLSEAEVARLASRYGDYTAYWAHYVRAGA
jgi:DNA-3-methyladenine glycosylase II